MSKYLENGTENLAWAFGKLSDGAGYSYHKTVELAESAQKFLTFQDLNEATLKLDVIAKIIILVGAIAYTTYHLSKVFRLKKTFRRIITDPVAAWSRKVVRKQSRTYRKNMENTIPVVAIMNDQDGVGKSTITANLAAYFDRAGLNVLVIDYDAKESLSHILPLKDDLHYSSDSILKSDISKKASLLDLPEPDELGEGFQHSWLCSSGKDLRKTEKELEYSWFMGKEKRDIRFNLHNYLSLPEIQEQYHIILIDAPAGMSAINANILCAATHVLVPTVLDKVSVSHTVDTLQDYQDFRQKLGLAFGFLGVLPSRLSTSKGVGNLAPLQETAMKMLETNLKAVCKRLVNPVTRKKETMAILNSWIYQYVDFQGDQNKMAYHEANQKIQPLVTALGGEIFSKLIFQDNQNLPQKTKKTRTHFREPLHVTGHKKAA